MYICNCSFLLDTGVRILRVLFSTRNCLMPSILITLMSILNVDIPSTHVAVVFQTCLKAVTPATLPNRPTHSSPTRPPSRLQCKVNGSQAQLLTSPLHQAPSATFFSSPFNSPSSPPLLNSYASLQNSNPTCAAQNLQLHFQALFCLSSLQPNTPLDAKYAQFSKT